MNHLAASKTGVPVVEKELEGICKIQSTEEAWRTIAYAPVSHKKWNTEKIKNTQQGRTIMWSEGNLAPWTYRQHAAMRFPTMNKEDSTDKQKEGHFCDPGGVSGNLGDPGWSVRQGSGQAGIGSGWLAGCFEFWPTFSVYDEELWQWQAFKYKKNVCLICFKDNIHAEGMNGKG